MNYTPMIGKVLTNKPTREGAIPYTGFANKQV